MDDKDLKLLQKTEFDIFMTFKTICEDNHLRYFLDGGTLLGAVRHQGFIPWDDDIDVGMPRTDYDRFCEIAGAILPKNIFLQTYFTDQNYPNAFAKLRMEGTEFIEVISKNSKMKGGIYIDILPFDNYPDKWYERLSQGVLVEIYKHLLIVKHNVYPWKGMRGYKRCLKFLEYLIFVPISVLFKHTWLVSRYEKALKKFNRKKTERIKEPDLRYGKVTVPYECANSFVNLPFENELCTCPENYDAFLKALYDDYMILPPVEDRVGWHGIERIMF